MPNSPEEWLEQAAPEESIGIFKLILGHCAGVGNTSNPLNVAIQRLLRNAPPVDVHIITQRAD